MNICFASASDRSTSTSLRRSSTPSCTKRKPPAVKVELPPRSSSLAFSSTSTLGALLLRGQGGAQRGVARANHDHVIRAGVRHGRSPAKRFGRLLTNGCPQRARRANGTRPDGEQLRWTRKPRTAWHEIVRDVLKRHKVAGHLCAGQRAAPADRAVHADPFFTAFAVAREEEGLGIIAGAWMGGRRGILLMQTSGFATLPNAIASLAVPFQIPVLMMVSERGTLGEFNIGQALVARTMRPVLDTLAIEHHTLTRLDEVEFIIDRSITPGGRHPGAVLFHPVAAADRRQSLRGIGGGQHGTSSEPPGQPRRRPRCMNRFDITQRMVARLHHDEAVIGGIGYTNFDLWARRPAARRISTCWAAWGWRCRSRWASRWRSRNAA